MGVVLISLALPLSRSAFPDIVAGGLVYVGFLFLFSCCLHAQSIELRGNEGGRVWQ